MPECPFCLDNNRLYADVLVRGKHCYVVTSDHPVLTQAVMIIPYRHAETPSEMTEAELLETMKLMQQTTSLLAETQPDGYTIGWNVGTIGGQTVSHAHLHVIARFADEPLAGQGLPSQWLSPPNSVVRKIQFSNRT